MKKVNEILGNRMYQEFLSKLDDLEKDRKFCLHNIQHCMDVARIAYIINLEENLGHSKEIIYAIALLHDIGRVLEYEKNIPHHEGSVILANLILEETSFNKSEKYTILKTINEHRNACEDSLSRIIYKADKLSRKCYACKSIEECYWADEKKNFDIRY